MQAREFIRSSQPDLIDRILEADQNRHAAELASIPPDLWSRILDGSAVHPSREQLYDPIEDDEIVGPIVRSIMEQAALDMEAQHGRVIGLCHAIWRLTRDRLLQEHSIVWYSPAQMNPGSCFD